MNSPKPAQPLTALVGAEKEVSAEDKSKLESLGWHFNDTYECWTIFT